jgi:hypothetical protein
MWDEYDQNVQNVYMYENIMKLIALHNENMQVKSWMCGSRGRVPTWQVQSPEFKP